MPSGSIRVDGDKVVFDEIVTDEMTTSELYVSMNEHLARIDYSMGILTVLCIAVVCWLGLWTVLSKWYFGGV